MKKIIECKMNEGLVFGFNNIESWEEFDLLLEIIKVDMGVKIIEMIEGPLSKVSIFIHNDIEMKLSFDDMIGNYVVSLCQGELENDYVRKFANKVYDIYKEKHG